MLRGQRIDIVQVTASVSPTDPLHVTLDTFASYLAPFRYSVIAVFERTYSKRLKRLQLLDVLFRAKPAERTKSPEAG
jgi:hypothetical protein